MPSTTRQRRVPAQTGAAKDGAAKDGAATSAAGDENGAGDAQRLVNGLEVVSDVALRSNLPVRAGHSPVEYRTLRLLTLADGATVIGCADCDFAGKRGDVLKHRHAEHNSPRGGAGNRREPMLDAAVAAMTVGELMGIARDAAQWGDLFATTEAKVEEWKDRALAAEAWRRKVTAKLSTVGFVLKLDDDEDD